jgi:hypothetical protein
MSAAVAPFFLLAAEKDFIKLFRSSTESDYSPLLSQLFETRQETVYFSFQETIEN